MSIPKQKSYARYGIETLKRAISKKNHRFRAGTLAAWPLLKRAYVSIGTRHAVVVEPHTRGSGSFVR